MIKKIIRRIKILASDRRWWGFFLQRRFLRPSTRNRLAARVASRLRPAAQHAPLDEAGWAASKSLSQSGIARLGDLLTAQACEELRRYFGALEAFDSYRPGSPRFLPADSDKRHPDAHIAHHLPEDVLRAPHLVALANDPHILGIVSEFLGCKPTIGYLATWWSYHTAKGAQQAEFFHRDVDDWKFVKLFVYLTDVGPENGPHVYVQHSSGSEKLTQIRRFADKEVQDAFGADNLLTMTAPAGRGFLEDTFGIHKGQPVVAGTRLIFQAVYGLSPLPYGPKSPVMSRDELDMLALDPWINRVYLR
jgi:Phytanoyl-CoA dioxygenase (PhyH)